MPTLVENARYLSPLDENPNYFLSESYDFKRDIIKGGYGNKINRYSELPNIAQEVGLIRTTRDFQTRKGTWHVYGGMTLAIPNFPEGETPIREALALYEREGETTAALLRVTPEPLTMGELADDLDAFTRYYIERPRLKGFPSEVLASDKTRAALFFGGIPVGGLVGFIVSGGDWNVASLSALAGQTLSASTELGLWRLSERRAKGKIVHRDEYISGDTAAGILAKQRDHMITTSIQRELYSALQESGSTMTPEQFLHDIYLQMPSTLINKRKQELERAKYPERYSELVSDKALPEMVGVAQILQAA